MISHNKIINVGSRGSNLALVQVEEIKSLLNQKGVSVSFKATTYKTNGDQDKKTPLTANVSDDFFTDTIDAALLNREIDVAIHSAKDLPKKLKEGLTIFALTKSLDDTDAFVGKSKLGELKPGAKIGTSSLVRQKSIKELFPQFEVINIRGTIEERLKLIDQGICDGIIVATAALKRLKLDHLIKDIMPWEATPLQGQLAIVGRSENHDLKELFAAIDIRRNYGKVYLVGAGPGDPDLITIKGVKSLKEAECVFYDYLAHKDLLNHATKAEKIYVGKRKGAHSLPQSELSKLLRQKAMEGKRVVRLKGGDPLVFGRGAEEIEYLRAYHIDVDVIPGVSSATAIPGHLGIPLTARGISSSVAFLSAHGEDETSAEDLLTIPQVETLVFLMGLTKLDVIIKSLKHVRWKETTPVIAISKGTRLDQKIVIGTIKDIEQKIKDQPLDAPVLIIVGETVNFYKTESCHQETILYTGAHPEKYQSLGRLVHLPMIEIREAPLSHEQKESIVKDLSGHDVILFTSCFAVENFFKVLAQQNYSTTNLKTKNFWVIGHGTREELIKHGFEPELVPKIETSEGLFNEIKAKKDLKGKHILFPRSSLPNPYLKNELTKLGAVVFEITIYENIRPVKRPLPKDNIDKVLFTSPSTVRNFLADYSTIPKHWRIISRGPLTSKALADAGYKNEVLIYG